MIHLNILIRTFLPLKELVGKEKNCTVAKIFIDTNILVYTLDKKDEEKTRISREAVKFITSEHSPVISTQVLQEFYNASTSKLKLDKILIKNIVHSYKNMEIVTIDLQLIEQAIDISVIFQLSFWDSLIVASAEQGNCEYLISEDLNSGQTIRGIKILNPIKEDLHKL
jgi:predicted nucleic acid-binding protein